MFFTISSRKINIKNSFFRKKDSFNVLDFAYLAMRFYRNCVMFNKIYYVSNDFKKCVKYMRLNRNYNLTILFTLIKRIYKKRLRLKKEVCETHAKLSC